MEYLSPLKFTASPSILNPNWALTWYDMGYINIRYYQTKAQTGRHLEHQKYYCGHPQYSCCHWWWLSINSLMLLMRCSLVDSMISDDVVVVVYICWCWRSWRSICWLLLLIKVIRWCCCCCVLLCNNIMMFLLQIVGSPWSRGLKLVLGFVVYRRWSTCDCSYMSRTPNNRHLPVLFCPWYTCGCTAKVNSWFLEPLTVRSLIAGWWCDGLDSEWLGSWYPDLNANAISINAQILWIKLNWQEIRLQRATFLRRCAKANGGWPAPFFRSLPARARARSVLLPN